uniref:Uncharacterized protein n=1 Tax=Ascaris lumbricoides TaxID=6252 RepID=A0A0M3HXA5_ASCLU
MKGNDEIPFNFRPSISSCLRFFVIVPEPFQRPDFVAVTTQANSIEDSAVIAVAGADQAHGPFHTNGCERVIRVASKP